MEKKRTVDLPLLRGWRKQLVGELLTQILEGTVTVSVDPTKGVLRMTGETSALPK
jgi:ribonuclease D